MSGSEEEYEIRDTRPSVQVPDPRTRRNASSRRPAMTSEHEANKPTPVGDVAYPA